MGDVLEDYFALVKSIFFFYLDIYFRLLSIATSTSTTTVIHGLYTID